MSLQSLKKTLFVNYPVLGTWLCPPVSYELFWSTGKTSVTPSDVTDNSRIKTQLYRNDQSTEVLNCGYCNSTSLNWVKCSLRVLRARGMPMECLHEVFCSTILARLTYASPAWSGFCSADDIKKIDSFINKSKLTNYLLKSPPIKQLFAEADTVFLKVF